MDVVLIGIGSSGDVHPLIGIGLALRERGHDITMLASTHFENQVGNAGLRFIGIGTDDDYHAVTSDPSLMHPLKGTQKVIEYCCIRPLREIYEIVADTYKPGETLVISGALGFGARIAHEKLGVPLVTTILQPMMFRSVHETARYDWFPFSARMPRFAKHAVFRAADLYADRLAGPATNSFRKELGLPPVKRIFHDWWMSPQLVIGLFPEWYGPLQPDWPPNTVLTGFPMYDESDTAVIPAEARDFLDNGDPPLVFTPGTAMRFGRKFFEASVEACRLLGRRGVLLSKFREQIPERLPPGVAHFDYLPLGGVLPRAAAMIHHGGMGTLAQALRAGIPHLVMPMAIDQPDNARRLAALGVADYLKPKAYRAKTVAEKLDKLLNSPDVAENCRRIARRFEDVHPRSDTCRVIEDFAARVM